MVIMLTMLIFVLRKNVLYFFLKLGSFDILVFGLNANRKNHINGLIWVDISLKNVYWPSKIFAIFIFWTCQLYGFK